VLTVFSQIAPDSGSNEEALEKSRAGRGGIDKVKGFVIIVFDFFVGFLRDFSVNLFYIAHK